MSTATALAGLLGRAVYMLVESSGSSNGLLWNLGELLLAEFQRSFEDALTKGFRRCMHSLD